MPSRTRTSAVTIRPISRLCYLKRDRLTNSKIGSEPFAVRACIVSADCKSDFAMLACATNPFQCLASSHAIRWAADRCFSTSESLLVFLDCGGAADRRDLAGARYGDSAIGWAGALAARHAVAGVRTRLRVRHSLGSWDLRLDLRHHASLRRAARAGCRAGAGLVLYVVGALFRNVRAAAGGGWVGPFCLGLRPAAPR